MPKTKPKPKQADGLKLDKKNARHHTPENLAMIGQSLDDVGAFRSIAVDGEGIVRAGEGVLTEARKRGLKVRIVDAKPGELIAVRRKDLKGAAAQRAALYDNRAAELGGWNLEVLAALPSKVKEGVWSADELAALSSVDGFVPKVDPSFSAAEVKESDVVKVQKQAEDKFKGQKQLDKVTCPKCGHDFFIEAEK